MQKGKHPGKVKCLFLESDGSCIIFQNALLKVSAGLIQLDSKPVKKIFVRRYRK